MGLMYKKTLALIVIGFRPIDAGIKFTNQHLLAVMGLFGVLVLLAWLLGQH